MRLAYSFLADAAEETNGRFFVFGGGLERVVCLAMPTSIASVAVVIKLRLEDRDRDSGHAFRLVGLGPNGLPCVPDLLANFGPFRQPALPGRTAYHLVLANYRGLPVTEYGPYRFVIYVDDQEMGSVSFFADPPPDRDPQND
ncbi:MAG: DUF6941 family protein [Isosphaeraceae bacterium]